MQPKVSGSWRSLGDEYVRVAGAWRRVGEEYVKVGSTWRRSHRIQDLLFNSNIVFWTENFLGNTYYSCQNDTNGNTVLGSFSNKYLTTGRVVANIQIGDVSEGAYPPRRWLTVMFHGDVPGLDIPSVEFNGQLSTAIIENGVFVGSPFNVTRYMFGFAADLPVTGTRNIKF